jgi:hypothetical protein
VKRPAHEGSGSGELNERGGGSGCLDDFQTPQLGRRKLKAGVSARARGKWENGNMGKWSPPSSEVSARVGQ